MRTGSAFEGAEQDGKLADEAVEAGQSGAAHGDDQEEAAEDRHALPEAAEVVQHTGVASFIEKPDEQEEGACAESVVDHLQHGAADGLVAEGHDAEHDIAEMGDGAIGDERLDVTLHERDERAVENADDGQERDPRAERAAASGNMGMAKRR